MLYRRRPVSSNTSSLPFPSDYGELVIAVPDLHAHSLPDLHRRHVIVEGGWRSPPIIGETGLVGSPVGAQRPLVVLRSPEFAFGVDSFVLGPVRGDYVRLAAKL